MKAWIKKHYHWLIASVVLLQLGVCGGSSNNLTNLHLVPVTGDLGFSRTAFSLAVSCKHAASMIVTFFSGTIFQKFGYRRPVLLSTVLFGAGYLLLFGMQNVWGLALGCAMLGVSHTFCSTAGASHVVSSWFVRHRGIVLGLVSAATGIGGSILCLGQTVLMERFSWRSSFLLCAGCILAVAVLMCFVVRDKPQQLGLTPYGADEAETKKHRVAETVKPGLPMQLLTRRSAFYLMILATFLSVLGLYVVYYSVVPHLTGQGLSLRQASSMQSLLLLLLTATKCLAGLFSDWIGIKRVSLICVMFGIVGILLLNTAESVTAAVIAIGVYSVSMPLMTITVPLLALSLFGYHAQSQYTGIFLSATSAASLLASPLANSLFDMLGSYRLAYWLAAGLCAAAFVAYLILYRLANKEQ